MDKGERQALRQDVSHIKIEVFRVIPTGVPIAVIIIALAELQMEMALLFFEEEEPEEDG